MDVDGRTGIAAGTRCWSVSFESLHGMPVFALA
jgi:hypothetical protein